MTRRTPQGGAKVPETQDPAYYEALGRAIKVARTELGLSRKELAARAKISYPYIADIESGRGRPSSSALLAVVGDDRLVVRSVHDAADVVRGCRVEPGIAQDLGVVHQEGSAEGIGIREQGQKDDDSEERVAAVDGLPHG